MLFSAKAKLAFLAMPKAGSTSIEYALRPHCNVVYSGSSDFTHMTARLFNTHMRPFFKHRKIGKFETCCIMRHPVSWLGSWYKYFGQSMFDELPQSTQNMSFSQFVELYLTRDNEAINTISRPWDFMRGHNGKLAVNLVFRYENMAEFHTFLEERFEQKFVFGQMNVSPERPTALSTGIARQLENYFSLEFDIYEKIM